MSSLLSRLVILLCIIGWIAYIDHANSNRSGNLASPDARAFAVSPPKQAAATPIQPDLQPIASAAEQSPHAIIPDATPPQASANSPAPPPQTENTKSLLQADQESALKPGSNQEPEEQLRVTSETSIRSGPSGSAQLIGRAHAGATLRVKSRDSGWVQFVDSVANETGWISMAYLGPADAAENTPQPPKSANVKTHKPTHKVAKFKTPNHSKFASVIGHRHPTYARLPADREFVPPRRRGFFGLFLSRRF
jgi:Bacterial SH3 domain